jgi:hypothetical protein
MRGRPNVLMGYIQITITSNRSPSGKQMKVYVHDLVCRAFHGERPEGKEVAHEDRNPSNNSAENLSWKTHAENQSDIRRHGSGRGRNSKKGMV